MLLDVYACVCVFACLHTVCAYMGAAICRKQKKTPQGSISTMGMLLSFYQDTNVVNHSTLKLQLQRRNHLITSDWLREGEVQG